MADPFSLHSEAGNTCPRPRGRCFRRPYGASYSDLRSTPSARTDFRFVR